MTDVGHAGTDEDLVDLGAGHVGQGLDVVGIVGAGQQRLLDVGQVDVDHRRVFGVGVRFHQGRVGQPLLHALDAALQGLGVLITIDDHPLEQRDVAVQVFDDRLLVQSHRAAGGGAFGGGIGQFEGLLHLQIGQALDFQDTAGEDVLLTFLRHRQQARLNRRVRNGVDQVAQGDAGLHGSLEAHQHRFRHVQRHGAGGGGERHQAGAGREADADREASVRIAAGADGVGQQHPVQPGVDDAVARPQRHAGAAGDEVGQGVVGLHVHRLGIGGGVAERLHDQIGGEAQAGQILQLVAGHRTGGVL